MGRGRRLCGKAVFPARAGAACALCWRAPCGATGRGAESFVFGGLAIDTASHTVTIDGEAVALTPKEFDLLVFLAANKGIALSREKILQQVWNYDYFGEDRTVDTHVKMLRSHLGKYRDFITTVWGVGYKFEPKAGVWRHSGKPARKSARIPARSWSMRAKLMGFIVLMVAVLLGLCVVLGVRSLGTFYEYGVRRDLARTLSVFSTLLDQAGLPGEAGYDDAALLKGWKENTGLLAGKF